MSRRPILGVSLDGIASPSAASQVNGGARGVIDVEGLVATARLAECAGFDFISLDDTLDPSAAVGLDAQLTLARIAPATSTIGLLGTVTVTHTEPFHVSKNIATLDLVSGGRAGWRVAVSTSTGAARRFGRKEPQPSDVLAAEAGDVVEVVRRLWDSWEDGAVIRDVPTGRYIDRDKLHYVDFVGNFFSVRGPSITPRSPQGQPIVAVSVDEWLGVDFAGQRADLVIVRASDVESARQLRNEVRAAAGRSGREEESVTVIVTTPVAEDTPAAELVDRIERWTEANATDGFLLESSASEATVERLASDVLPLIERRPIAIDGVAPTFRGRLGLARPINRYHEAGAPA